LRAVETALGVIAVRVGPAAKSSFPT
jgi:hypothetical protein